MTLSHIYRALCAVGLLASAGCSAGDRGGIAARPCAGPFPSEGMPVTILLVPSGPAAVSAARAIADQRDFRGLGIVASYAGPEPYRELARATISGHGAPNRKYAAAEVAAARRCLTETVATVATTLPPAGRGDALTAVALGFEAARRVTGDVHRARVVVYGAGTLVTSGLDLAVPDLSTAERQDAVVVALQSNGLLDVRGGPQSEVVFAGLSDDAANGVVGRQREALFKRLCAAIDVAACATAMRTAV